MEFGRRSAVPLVPGGMPHDGQIEADDLAVPNLEHAGLESLAHPQRVIEVIGLGFIDNHR